MFLALPDWLVKRQQIRPLAILGVHQGADFPGRRIPACLSVLRAACFGIDAISTRESLARFRLRKEYAGGTRMDLEIKKKLFLSWTNVVASGGAVLKPHHNVGPNI